MDKLIDILCDVDDFLPSIYSSMGKTPMS